MGLRHFTVISSTGSPKARGREEGECKKWIKGRLIFNKHTLQPKPEASLHNIHIRAIYTKLKKVLFTNVHEHMMELSLRNMHQEVFVSNIPALWVLYQADLFITNWMK